MERLLEAVTAVVGLVSPEKARALAGARGVSVSMLLESSRDRGGNVSFDVIGKMRAQVPCAKLFAWREREAQFADGRVHAKVAVADGRVRFITSANLTGHAMERNMEAGVLVRGGDLPADLHRHLDALIAARVIESVEAEPGT